MPAKPKMMMDDEYVQETTRRVGGRGAPAPSMGMPSMGAMPMPMPSGFGRSAMRPTPNFGGPSMSTAPMKAAPQMAPAPPPRPSHYIWKLRNVPTLPEFHHVERTAVYVPNASPTIVAERISNVLRERSIEASYDDTKAKVTCATTDGVDFRIRLYRGRNKYSSGIIVEIQRRFGSPISFHIAATAVLNAAEGKRPIPSSSSSASLPLPSDEDDYVPPPPSSGSSSLNMIARMLSHPGYDSQYLGLQTLSSLVDPSKMGKLSARSASRELLKNNSEVGAKVLAYASDRNSDCQSAMGLRVMAIGIIANSLQASGYVPEFFRNSSLRDVLVQDVREADKQPRTAFLASKCLEYCVRGDYNVSELNSAFEVALRVGQSKHLDLMRQAERCMAQIR